MPRVHSPTVTGGHRALAMLARGSFAVLFVWPLVHVVSSSLIVMPVWLMTDIPSFRSEAGPYGIQSSSWAGISAPQTEKLPYLKRHTCGEVGGRMWGRELTWPWWIAALVSRRKEHQVGPRPDRTWLRNAMDKYQRYSSCTNSGFPPGCTSTVLTAEYRVLYVYRDLPRGENGSVHFYSRYLRSRRHRS
jgi:hypothetical protein